MSARWIRFALLTLAALAGSAFGAPLAIVTIADGEVALIRDTQRFAVTEGLRLRGDDIVHTAPSARLVRIEFTDGSALDLGPDTQVLLPSGGSRNAYLAQGWAKFNGAKGSQLSIGTPRLEITELEGTAVLRVTKELGAVFVESGHAELLDRRGGNSIPTPSLRDGHTIVLRGDEAARLQARPPAEMLGALPRGFADSLPLRAKRFQAQAIEPQAGVEVRYAEVSPWLNAESAVRNPLVARFRPLAKDRAFRAGLVADLNAHPEWDRVLHPAKYRPKHPNSAVKSAAAAPAASAAAR